MGVFAFLSYSTQENASSSTESRAVLESAQINVTSDQNASTVIAESAVISLKNKESAEVPGVETQVRVRRFTFRSLPFVRKDSADQKTALSSTQEQDKREHAAESSVKRAVKVSRSDRRAKQSALALRSIIVGPTATVAPQVTPAVAKPQLSKIKSQLMQTKSANKLIAQLRELPASGDPSGDHSNCAKGPIHAVCLEHTDAEEDTLHFAKLSIEQAGLTSQNIYLPGVISAPVDKLAAMFNDMHIIDLVKAPDFGLGQPGDGEGLLAGALPTAGTVIEGVKQITPELMALGYATGQAFVPDHSGIYPPTDRMSVLTYWWGLEVLLPTPSLHYLSNAQSITGAIMNFLSALSLVNNGVREILPFVRYIAQFIDFEFNAIKRQDRGEGVVCAATWIMPAAMIPRPWDFPLPPQVPTQPTDDTTKPSTLPVGVILPPNPLPRLAPSVLGTTSDSPVKNLPVPKSPVAVSQS
ncbi:hypothetical protein B0H34DRAFT_364966 [Crassisporium funariophilum]|nr:hypothetical protein B0H34DRAFT_364966 [Crassisporium funariophilum]